MRSSNTISSILLILVVYSISIEAYNSKELNYARFTRAVNRKEPLDHDPAKISKGGNIYLPSEQSGINVAEWNPSMLMNPEELGDYPGGDILNPEQLKRNGLKDPAKRWHNGVIPYTISKAFNSDQVNMIHSAMKQYHDKTCIKFRPHRSTDTDYIRILAGKSGCWSSIGRVGGPQDVNLQIPGCVTKVGTIVHEFMHAVGFLHEQSREDRDRYVKIFPQNIEKGHERNFDKAKISSTDDQGQSYDYMSVMHYSAYAFSKNKRPTIAPLKPISQPLGQRVGFSTKDARKINLMYRCPK